MRENRGAERDCLVRVHRLGRLLAEELAQLRAHERHAALSADQEHFAELRRPETAVVEHVVADAQRAVDQLHGQLLQLRPRHLAVEVVAFVADHGDERNVHLRGQALRERDLGALGSVGDPLEGDAIAFESDPVLLVEPGQEVLHERPVEVDAAEERVSAGGNHLVDVSVQLEDAGVEGTAAEVVDHHPLLERPALREGDRRRGRLVDDALHVEPRQGASGTDGLALVVVVVGGHGDHRARDLGAEPPLGQILHLREHERGDLLQREDLIPHLHRGLAARAGNDLVAEPVQ